MADLEGPDAIRGHLAAAVGHLQRGRTEHDDLAVEVALARIDWLLDRLHDALTREVTPVCDHSDSREDCVLVMSEAGRLICRQHPPIPIPRERPDGLPGPLLPETA